MKAIFFLAFLSLFISCKSNKAEIIYTNKCKDVAFEFSVQSKSAMDPNITSLFFQLGKHQKFEWINAKGKFYTHFHKNIPDKNIISVSEDNPVKSIALFIDSNSMTYDEFKFLGYCLRTNFDNISQFFNQLKEQKTALAMHAAAFDIDAIVYGKAEDYAEAFTDSLSGTHLMLMPDGTCVLYKLQNNQKEYLAVDPNVQWLNFNPISKTIFIKYADKEIAKKTISAFKNINGKSINEVYKIELLNEQEAQLHITSPKSNSDSIYYVLGSLPSPEQASAYYFISWKYGLKIPFIHPIIGDVDSAYAFAKWHNDITLSFLDEKFPDINDKQIGNELNIYIDNWRKYYPILSQKYNIDSMSGDAYAKDGMIIFNFSDPNHPDKSDIEIILHSFKQKLTKQLAIYKANQ